MNLPQITDAEYEAGEKVRKRMGRGVPTLVELGATEQGHALSLAAKAGLVIEALTLQLGAQTAANMALQEELESRRQVQHQSMGLGPERKKVET